MFAPWLRRSAGKLSAEGGRKTTTRTPTASHRPANHYHATSDLSSQYERNLLEKYGGHYKYHDHQLRPTSPIGAGPPPLNPSKVRKRFGTRYVVDETREGRVFIPVKEEPSDDSSEDDIGEDDHCQFMSPPPCSFHYSKRRAIPPPPSSASLTMGCWKQHSSAAAASMAQTHHHQRRSGPMSCSLIGNSAAMLPPYHRQESPTIKLPNATGGSPPTLHEHYYEWSARPAPNSCALNLHPACAKRRSHQGAYRASQWATSQVVSPPLESWYRQSSNKKMDSNYYREDNRHHHQCYSYDEKETIPADVAIVEETADEIAEDCQAHHPNHVQSPSIKKASPLLTQQTRHFMLDPYSSSSREFIAARQMLFLTKSRPTQETINRLPPDVWIVNYYGSWSSQAFVKCAPGRTLTIAETYGRVEHEEDKYLGYLQVGGGACHLPGEDLLFLSRVIGRGGTSAVFSGWTSSSSHKLRSPNVIKILHQKHWKCALAELVAALATFERMRKRLHENARSRVTAKLGSDCNSASPSTAASGGCLPDNNRNLNSCFIEGGFWLIPTELHIFWNMASAPVALASTDEEDEEHQFLKTSVNLLAHESTPLLCCLMMRGVSEGVPLLSWLNSVFVKRRKKPSQEICIYFAFVITSLVRQLHSCGLIHGDVKPDNFVLFPQHASFPHKSLLTQLQRRNPLLKELLGINNHPPVLIAGIDFGRSLDIEETLKDVLFSGDTQVSDFRCPPMIDKEPWETQIDTTGLAVTIFTIISLKYPKIRKKVSKMEGESGSLSGCDYSTRGRLHSKYWFGPRVRSNSKQNAFWISIIDDLINFRPDNSLKPTNIDSCVLLESIEKRLVEVFFRNFSQANLQVELAKLFEFVEQHQKGVIHSNAGG